MAQAQESRSAKEPAEEGHREVRSLALRLLAQIWRRFPGGCDYASLWPRFFEAAQPLVPRLLVEVCIPLIVYAG